jgi:hypothetical protein
MKATTKIAPKRLPERRFTQKPPVEQWGQDHWSLLAYIQTRCVDYGGEINLDHFRCNEKRHPGFVARHSKWSPSSGTRLKFDITLPGHDDHDVAADLEAAGLLKHIGTGVNPVFKLTAEGWRVVNLLFQHKAAGQNYASFNYPHPKPPTLQEELDDLRRRAAQACTCDGGNTRGCSACVAERQLTNFDLTGQTV